MFNDLFIFYILFPRFLQFFLFRRFSILYVFLHFFNSAKRKDEDIREHTGFLIFFFSCFFFLIFFGGWVRVFCMKTSACHLFFFVEAIITELCTEQVLEEMDRVKEPEYTRPFQRTSNKFFAVVICHEMNTFQRKYTFLTPHTLSLSLSPLSLSDFFHGYILIK